MRCPNPKCRHRKYNTVKSENRITARLRTLRCRACGQTWKTEEIYDQSLDTEVFRTEKSAEDYNVRLRLIRNEDRVLRTREIRLDEALNPIEIDTLDLFSEAI